MGKFFLKKLKNEKRQNFFLFSIICLFLFFISCDQGGVNNGCMKLPEPNPRTPINYPNKNYVQYPDQSFISKDFSTADKKCAQVFTKYIQYFAPNGQVINILAQEQISDEMLLRAYNILSFYLTSNKNYDKSELANALANSGAAIVMPNGKDGDDNSQAKKAARVGQPVYYSETPVEGSSWYQNNDYTHRDAAFEEIFHFVHDYGIGTTQSKGVLPHLSQKIATGLKNALPNNESDWGNYGLWGLNSQDWLKELKKEGSLEQEYIVSGIDSYYGLWEAYPNIGGMWGIYAAKTRAQVKTQDPIAAEIITTFLGDDLTYMARIASSFTGTFKMQFDDTAFYTYKSQYLNNARLTGSNDSNLTGNNRNNILIGNAGNNLIDGQDGQDTVQFAGKSLDYTIEEEGEYIKITDHLTNDGIDSLKNIEILRFTDKDIAVSSLNFY